MEINCSLIKDQNYITEIKKIICNFSNESFFSSQLKWELLIYEVRKFTIKYTKHVAKDKPKQRTNLKKQLKKT